MATSNDNTLHDILKARVKALGYELICDDPSYASPDNRGYYVIDPVKRTVIVHDLSLEQMERDVSDLPTRGSAVDVAKPLAGDAVTDNALNHADETTPRYTLLAHSAEGGPGEIADAIFAVSALGKAIDRLSDHNDDIRGLACAVRSVGETLTTALCNAPASHPPRKGGEQ